MCDIGFLGWLSEWSECELFAVLSGRSKCVYCAMCWSFRGYVERLLWQAGAQWGFEFCGRGNLTRRMRGVYMTMRMGRYVCLYCDDRAGAAEYPKRGTHGCAFGVPAVCA